MNKENFFKKNMEKLEKDIKSGELIILSSGKQICFSLDTSYRFRVNKSFYYYTGIDTDGVYFLVFKSGSTITKKVFYDFVDEKLVRWIGRKLTITEIKEKLGVNSKEVYPKERLSSEIKNLFSIGRIETIYLTFPMEDSFLMDILYNELGMKDKTKTFRYENVDKFASLHRPIKEEYEIEQMQEAIDITDGAIRTVMKNIATCKTENEAEAYLDFYFKKRGAFNKAFDSIFASGKNGVILHYSSNNAKLNRKELLLMDVGAEYNNYCADVSRTIPIGGKFTDLQKKYYNIVLRTNKIVIEHIKVGMTFKQLNDFTNEFLINELIRVGLIKENIELNKYYFHSVSHPLGLDAHDLKADSEKIEEGMVITVEPGLYIAEEGIGIRIEDDVYVTEDENIVLTDNIPKEIIDIENCMKDYFN